MPLRKVRAKRSVNTRGGGADAGNVGKLRDALSSANKVMGRRIRPKIPKDLIDKYRKKGPKKRKPMTPLKKKGKA